MSLIFRKTFDWEEDLKNFDSDELLTRRCGHYGRRLLFKKLTWKGKLRKFFRIKKPV